MGRTGGGGEGEVGKGTGRSKGRRGEEERQWGVGDTGIKIRVSMSKLPSHRLEEPTGPENGEIGFSPNSAMKQRGGMGTWSLREPCLGSREPSEEDGLRCAGGG